MRVGRFRVAEHAQKTQTKVDVFDYASGNKAVKAFVPSDWSFYDAKGRLLTFLALNGHIEAKKNDNYI
jgi:hypothetical protein